MLEVPLPHGKRLIVGPAHSAPSAIELTAELSVGPEEAGGPGARSCKLVRD